MRVAQKEVVVPRIHASRPVSGTAGIVSFLTQGVEVHFAGMFRYVPLALVTESAERLPAIRQDHDEIGSAILECLKSDDRGHGLVVYMDGGKYL